MKKLILFTILISLSFFAKSQTQLITNGNFSSGWSGWGLTANFWATTTFTNCQVCPGYAYAGASNGTSLIYNQEYLTQTLTVPSNTTSATLTYYTSATLSGTSTGNERLYVYIYDLTAGSTATFANVYFSTTVGYNLYSITLPSSTFGHSIEVGFRAESPSIASTIRVDEVSLLANVSTCTPASFSSQPINQSSTTGNIASFSVNVNGTAPITYQWYKNSTLISGATNSTYTTPTLTIADNGNTYYCNVTNCSGTTNINSNSAILTVTNSCTGATISTQPNNQNATTGNTANFSIIANGTAPITYQWYKNSSPIATNGTSSTYTTPTLTIADNGNTYYCNVTNCSGTTNINSNSATLTVTNSCAGATISTQPNNQNATTGNTATFSVIANGTAPITYQWYKNSSPIATNGTSSTYITPTLSIADNGNTYYCNVTNCSGTTNINSNSATLTVTNTTTLPNLIIDSPQISNPSPVAGSITYITFLVKNTGTISASANYVSLHLSSDNIFQSGVDLFLKDTLTFSIAPNSSQLFTIPITIPISTISGTWYMLISADGTNLNVETDENDNTSFVGLNVTSCYNGNSYASSTNYFGSGDPAYADCMNNYVNCPNPIYNSCPYTVDNWSFYKYQCVSYVAYMVNKSWGYSYPNKKFDNSFPIYLSNAVNWASKLDDFYVVNTTASVGAIAWWDDHNGDGGIGSSGHVAFVDCVNGSNVTLSEYNYNPACGYGSRIVDMSQPFQAGNRKPDKFIHTQVGGLGSATSIEEILNNDLLVYPNPTTDKVTIEINRADFKIKYLEVYNSLGIKLNTNYKLTKNNLAEIQLNDFPKGVYFIRINDGNRYLNYKIQKI